MSLDYATLDLLRQSHPAWRVMAQADLAEALEDELFALPRSLLGRYRHPRLRNP